MGRSTGAVFEQICVNFESVSELDRIFYNQARDYVRRPRRENAWPDR